MEVIFTDALPLCYHQRMPRKGRRRCAYSLRRKYNMTRADFERRLEEQEFRCLICRGDVDPQYDEKSPRSTCAVVDHCHRTGRVRGILCARCNSGIGFFHDDPSRLLRAAAYLHGHWKAVEGDQTPVAPDHVSGRKKTMEQWLEEAKRERFIEFSDEVVAAVDSVFKEVLGDEWNGEAPFSQPIRPAKPPRASVREPHIMRTSWGEEVNLNDAATIERLGSDPQLAFEVDRYIMKRAHDG
jgi:hypothetical protein